MNEIALNRINKVIQTEATTSSMGDFLLTHAPFENLYQDSNNKKSITEKQLLRELLKNSGEHKFIMIQGSNGSGKSHLIRWLKTKYENKVDHDQEAVLLISRAHNTLQDTLTQLLESDIFPAEIREKELIKIKDAKGNITGGELNKTINFNFTLEIDADKKSSAEILELRYRDRMKTFLMDDYIQENFLLKPDGPIERIRSKIETVNESTVNLSESAMFLPDDFEISLGQISKGLKISGTRAAAHTISLAEDFADPGRGPKLRQKVADYLNTKVSNVIQRSMKLQTSDFKDLFVSLRKALKKQGMNLTLFVEDINSFTGIDEALMEVLLTNHNAVGNEDYCRMNSVVGSTNIFYRDKLNESIKERIKYNIYIQEKSVLGNPSQVAKFAARYINAINLTETDITDWLNKGVNDEDLPVAPGGHSWAEIECDGKTLSIFPFNQTALWKLYEGLTPNKKTPRVFLKSIISHILKLWYHSPDTLLLDENHFTNAEIALPYWESPLHKTANSNMDNHSEIPRGILLKLWGDGTTNRESGLLGGLPGEVFKAFDVVADITGKAGTGPTAVVPTVPVETIETKKTETERPKKLIEIETELEDWLNNEKTLSYHIVLRECLYPFIVSGINWELEGVPMLLVTNYMNLRGRVYIEGQNAGIGEGFMLERNAASQALLIALANWKYAGNNTWDFESSSDYLITATAWLDKNKSKIVEGVMAPEGKVGEWDLPLWNVGALYCVKTLFGGLDISKSSEDLVVELLGSVPEFTAVTTHSQSWQELQDLALKDTGYKDQIFKDTKAYFSKSIGSAEAGGTKYIFVDAIEILKQVRKLKKLKWNLTGLCSVEQTNQKGSWYIAPNFINVFLNKISNIMEAENSQATKYLSFFEEVFEGDFGESAVTESIQKMADFLAFLTDNLNISYKEEDYKIIKPSTAPKNLVASLNKVRRLQEEQGESETLMKLAKNPFNEIENFFTCFIAFNNLLNEKENKFDSCVDTASRQITEDYKKTIISGLNDLMTQIESIGEV